MSRRTLTSPEFQLACACAATPAAPDRVREIAAGVDWGLFAKIVARHRIDGLAQRALDEAGLAVPEQVRSRARSTALAALKLTAECWRLQEAFDAGGIALTFLKGPVLARLAYGDVGIRHSKDIDLFVGRGDVEAAWALLEELGYTRVTPPKALAGDALATFLQLSKDSTFVHGARGVEVELHWRLTSSLEVAALAGAERQRVDMGGVSLTTFSDEALFIYLCVHGSSHGWMRLKWLADIPALMQRAPDAWRAAQGTAAEAPVEAALRLASELLGAPLPGDMPVSPGWRVQALMAVSRRSLSAGGGHVEPHRLAWGRLGEPLSELLMLRSPSAFARHLWRMSVPAEDVVLIRLPRGLVGLYPLLRLPLWVAKNLFGLGRPRRAG